MTKMTTWYALGLFGVTKFFLKKIITFNVKCYNEILFNEQFSRHSAPASGYVNEVTIIIDVKSKTMYVLFLYTRLIY